MQDYRAKAGSVIVIDVDTGEVLAMVNQPSDNPNDPTSSRRPSTATARRRTFSSPAEHQALHMAAALSSGQYRPDSVVDTSPGFIQVGNKVFEDEHDFGDRPGDHPRQIEQRRHRQGRPLLEARADLEHPHVARFGRSPAANSRANPPACTNDTHWRPIGIATLSHGYGLSVTPLQLAHAYATIGAGGIKRPISFERLSGRAVPGEQVLDPKVARELVQLMEQVVEKAHGRARFAHRLSRLRKTGTAFKSEAGGFHRPDHGGIRRPGARFAPETRDGGGDRRAEPDVREVGTLAQGGTVAAPVFAT